MRYVVVDETNGLPCLGCGSHTKKFNTGVEPETHNGIHTGFQCKVTIITIRHYIDCRLWEPADGFRKRPKPQEGDN